MNTTEKLESTLTQFKRAFFHLKTAETSVYGDARTRYLLGIEVVFANIRLLEETIEEVKNGQDN